MIFVLPVFMPSFVMLLQAVSQRAARMHVAKILLLLLQGEYVAAEKLEGEYKKCSYVNQIWVYGAHKLKCFSTKTVYSGSDMPQLVSN